jgi:hypothetical protein
MRLSFAVKVSFQSATATRIRTEGNKVEVVLPFSESLATDKGVVADSQ